MIDIYLFGVNSLSQQISDYISTRNNYNLLGITLNGEYCTNSEAFGHQLIPFEDISEKGGDFGIINCIGHRKAFSIRQKIDEMIISKSIPLLSFVHEHADIARDVEIGVGCLVFKNSSISVSCKIGNSNIFYNCSVGHDSIIGNYNWFGSGAVCACNVKIGDYCFIGNNATLKNCITLSSFTTVGAASYANYNTTMYEVLSPPETRSVILSEPLYMEDKIL